MKRISKIFFVPLIILLLTAERCGEARENVREEMIIEFQKREISRQFAPENLSEPTLLEYEKEARQKVADFFDCLNILTDSSLQYPFREKAGEMIQSLFLSDTSRIKTYTINGNDREYNVNQFIKDGLNNHLPSGKMIYDSIRIDHPFQRTGQGDYFAELSFILKSNGSHDDYSNMISERGKINAQIIKRIKIFGSDTISVWTLVIVRASLLTSEKSE